MLIFPGSKCLHQTNCTLEDNWTVATHHTLHGFSTFFVLLGGWALGGSSHDGRKWLIPMVIVFAPPIPESWWDPFQIGLLWPYKRGMIRLTRILTGMILPVAPSSELQSSSNLSILRGPQNWGDDPDFYSCCGETRCPPYHPVTRVAMLCLTSLSGTLRLHEDLWGQWGSAAGKSRQPSQCRLSPPENSKNSIWKWMLGIRFRFLFGAFWKVAKNSFWGSVGVVDSPNSLESFSIILICRVLERICA